MYSGKKPQPYNILVAIDGSDYSIKAAGYAIEIASEYKAQLIALYVLDISKIAYGASGFISSPIHGIEELESSRKEAQVWLGKVGKMILQDDKNIRFTSQIEESLSVAGAIVEYAESQNVDLIVLGSRGRSGFKKLLLGSVASKVITYARCPVLVAK